MFNFLENLWSSSDEQEHENNNKSWLDFSFMEDTQEKTAFENAKQEATSEEGLKLKESVSSSYSSPEDTARIKFGLNQTGYFDDEPTTIPNQKMIEGIKNFQKDNGLNVDGYIKPQGETITAMNSKLKDFYANKKHESGTEKGEKEFIRWQLRENKEEKQEMAKPKPLTEPSSLMPKQTKLSEQNLFTRAIEHLRKEENDKDFIYLDTKGKKTVGVGTNVDDRKKFMSINWQKDNRPATEQEKNEAFEIFENIIQRKEYGQRYGAKRYENKSSLRISKETSDKLLKEHLKDDLISLRKTFTEFDSFPEELQDVLLDIKYNVGNVSDEKWPKLHKGIKNRDLNSILKNVHRKDVPERRNIWAEDKIRAIKKW